MSKTHKVVVKGGTISLGRKKDFSSGTFDLESMLDIERISDDGDHGATIILKDGGLRKILRCKGIYPFLSGAVERDQIADWFVRLCLSTNSELQFLCLSTALPGEKVLNKMRKQNGTENVYLKWWQDYLEKWFLRVCDLHYIPDRRFYIVFGTDPVADGGECNAMQKSLLQERLTKLKSCLDTTTMDSHVLDRAQVRHLLQLLSNPCVDDLKLVEEIPEYESASSICIPKGFEKNNCLQIANANISTLYLSMLPKEVYLGWLIGWWNLPLSNLLCLHTKPLELEPEERRVQLSLACTSWDKSQDSLSSRCLQIRQTFTEAGAIVDSVETWQSDAWLSVFPLLRNRIPLSHNVESKIIGSFYPFIETDLGHDAGVLIGFSVASRDPVFFDPFLVDSENRGVLVCGSEKQKRLLLKVLVSRFLPTGAKLRIIHDSDNMRFLGDTMGPGDFRYVEARNIKDMDITLNSSSIELVNTKNCAPASKGRLEAAFCAAWSALVREMQPDERLVLIVNDVARLASSKQGRKELRQLIECSKLPNFSVILGISDPEQHIDNSELHRILANLSNRFILPERKKEKLKALQAFGLNEMELNAIEKHKSEDKSILCLLQLAGKSGMLRLVMTPQEYWLLADSSDRKAEIKRMIKEVKEKNPGINLADAQRQAIYYLGIRED